VAVQAPRAVQVDANEREAILEGTTELVAEVRGARNKHGHDDVISVVFPANPDVTPIPAWRPGRSVQGVTLLCGTEIALPHALPSVVRMLMHIATGKPRSAMSTSTCAVPQRCGLGHRQ